jgi:hypothetical protein
MQKLIKLHIEHIEGSIKWEKERDIYEKNYKLLKEKNAKFDINLKQDWLLSQSNGLKSYIECNILNNITKNPKKKYFYWWLQGIVYKSTDIYKVYKHVLFDYMLVDKTLINIIIDGDWDEPDSADNLTNILHKYYSFSTMLEKLMEDDLGVNEFDDEEFKEFKGEDFDETEIIYLK